MINTCHIILIGTELLNGMMVDTNSIYLAEELNEFGIKISGKSVVGDNIDDIVRVLSNVQKREDMVIISGGLGPTVDDITRDAVAKYLKRDLVFNEEEYEKIKSKFENLRRKMPKNNKKQALFPEGSQVIENIKGMAPAFFVENIGVFPGVPNELKVTFPKYLKNYVGGIQKEKNYIKDLLLWGLPESTIEEEIQDIVEDLNTNNNIEIEFLAKDYGIIIRFLGAMSRKKDILEIVDNIYSRLGNYIFGEDNDRIEKILFQKLIQKDYTLSTAESCTGGLVADKLVSLPGISKYYIEGLITYSNDSKIKRLQVKPETLEKKGAVSKDTVFEMLDGLQTDLGIAISGIAGPTGGTKEKPVGTVIIGIKIREKKHIEKHIFHGNRNEIRRRATLSSLFFLEKNLN
ncbi:MAG: competence/damage-inducible protein A [Fusobacteriota bacterium]